MRNFTLLLLLISYTSFAQEFTLEGTIIGKDNTKAFITFDGKEDSVQIQNGKLIYQGITSLPAQVGLNFGGPMQSVLLIVEPGTNKFEYHPGQMRLTFNNRSQQQFRQAQRTINKSRGELMKLSMARTLIQQKGKWQSFMDYAVAEGLEKLYSRRLDSAYYIVFNQNKDSMLAPLLLAHWSQENPHSNLLYHTVDELSEKPAYSWIRKLGARMNIDTLTSAEYAKDFTLKNESGQSVSLKSFRGKYLFVDFWASWCGPCRAENPYVVKAFKKYGTNNFTVLGVALEYQNGKKAWLDAIKKDGLTWTQLTDFKGWQSPVAKLYKIESIPQNLLLAPDGRIIARNLRGPQLDRILEKIFGEKAVRTF